MAFYYLLLMGKSLKILMIFYDLHNILKNITRFKTFHIKSEICFPKKHADIIPTSSSFFSYYVWWVL